MSDAKKGFFLAVGVLAAIVVVGFLSKAFMK